MDTVRTDAERTGARNDSNVRTTRFSTDDRQLGQYHYPHLLFLSRLTGSAPNPSLSPCRRRHTAPPDNVIGTVS